MIGRISIDNMTEESRAEDFIADAERHNEWWSEGVGQDLEEATNLTPRSDFHKVLEAVHEQDKKGTDNLVYPIYGSTGIGKTTLLYQLIAALIGTTEFPPKDPEFDIVSSTSPRQILYLPLEESQYHLERPNEGIERLKQVIDYFYTHIAPRHGRKYILLDDVDILNLDENEKETLLEFVNEDTYLFLTGIVRDQVNLRELTKADKIDHVERPWGVLPMKFVDTIGHPEDEGGLNVDFNHEFREQLESLRSDRRSGPNPIKDVRRELNLKSSDTGIDSAIESLNSLYFDFFDSSERDDLHDAARDYLRKGGTLHQTDRSSVRNEIVRSHFLLYLYKGLAKYGSIQNPENLHRLSSIAASQGGEELQYTEISDRIGVDRRTVDSYLDILDDGIAVTESHDYSLRRHRRTRLYLRNPRHVVLLSQRQEHFGFEEYSQQNDLNFDFEYKLARTVAFDHAMRLSFAVKAYEVEYCPTDAGLVDYVLHREGKVLPFILSYHPHTESAEQIATEFDPSVGQHTEDDSEDLRELDYEAPYRFIITDSLPKEVRENGSLVIEKDDVSICYLPFWLFLLIC
jgi:predicted AAA+ superfamily ATPase